MKDGFYESDEEFVNDFITLEYTEGKKSPRLYLINTDIGSLCIKEEKNENGVTFGFKIYRDINKLYIDSIFEKIKCKDPNLEECYTVFYELFSNENKYRYSEQEKYSIFLYNLFFKEIECKYSKEKLREEVRNDLKRGGLKRGIQSILKGIMNKLNFNVVKEKGIRFRYLFELYNSLSDKEIYNEDLEPGKGKNICDIIKKYQEKMKLDSKKGSKDFCVVFLNTCKHILTLIIPKDIRQKTIVINSMNYKTDQDSVEKIKKLSNKDVIKNLDKFTLDILFLKKEREKMGLVFMPNILEKFNIPMSELNQLNNISYIQYTVQENGSCCVFGSTFAELCAGKKNYEEVCEYLGIEQRDAPILTDAYNSIKTGFPNAVSTIFCQDPNKIEQLTFKNYIPSLGEYLKCIYDNVSRAQPSNDLQYCRAVDNNMIKIQKAESYYDWNNYERYKKYITIVKEGSPLYDYIKNYTKSLEDALKDMKDMTQKQGSAITK